MVNNIVLFLFTKGSQSVTNDGSNWFLAPDPQKANLLCRFWITGRRLTSRLTLDPRELDWKGLLQDQITLVPLF